MDKFIGRENELKSLNEMYDSNHFEMAVIYGRRRVGKSTLIKEFIKDKKYVFWSAIKTTGKRNLELFAQEAIQTLAPEMQNFKAEHPEDLFQFLGKVCRNERIAIVIDEFPYWAEMDSGIISVMQNAIDHDWKNGKMFLILCGSSVSFMEKQVLSEKSPLYGRRTGQLKLEPFKYWDAAKFVPHYSYEEKAVCYGVTGGVPYYLSLIDESRSLKENLFRLFFTRSGYLYGEVNYLLEEEFNDVANYSAVIDAIAHGSSKPSEIADKAHLEITAVSHKLSTLMETGIAERKSAVTDESNKKKVMYVLKDGMFRFWYKFVPNAIPLIELDRSRTYFDRMVVPKIPEYMGDIFEDMCQDYTLLQGAEGNLSCFVTKTGKWWGTDPRIRKTADIDVVGIDPIGNQSVLGECKYKNELFGKAEYETLMNRTGLIDHKYPTVQYLLFSKSGFSDWVIENHTANVELIDIRKLYSV